MRKNQMSLAALILLVLLNFVGCSASKQNVAEDDLPQAVTEDDLNSDGEFITETNDFSTINDTAMESLPQDDLEVLAQDMPMSDEYSSPVDLSVSPEQSAMPMETSSMNSMDSISEDTTEAFYEVQSGDTLMLVAFKIYGDYKMWKMIALRNTGKYGNDHSLAPGTRLSYIPPAVPFNWNPEGNPYLIKWGDSLSRISKKVYGNPSNWKKIHNNNLPMIKNPNLIFAGFTLYWLQDQQSKLN